MAHPNRPNRGVTLVKLLGVLVVTGVLAAGVFVPVLGGIGLAGKSEADRFLDTTCTLQETTPTTKTTIYASDNKTVIAQFFAQNRTPVTLAQINKLTQLALIDTEDRRFYDHHGVDARGLLRAAVSNSESSGDTQGGSTLTMQYVKQLRLYNANSDAERAAAVVQNVDRKLQDAKCALDLEQRETAQLGSETAAKNKILESYFNIAFFGQNSYGIEAAAKTYFNTTALKLAPQQAALIVGLVQAPSQYDPYTNPKDALDRRNQVLDNLVTAGHMTAADATKYKALPLGLTAKTPPPVQMGCSYATAIPNAGFFCDYATDWLAAHNYSSDALLRDGLKIRTTLDAGLQTQGQNAVWSGDPSTPGGAFAPDSASSLVMPSIDPRNGYVTTMITSRHYVDPNNPDPHQTSVRLFTTAAAGAGSTYKYFTTLVALAAGIPIDYTLNAGAPYTAKHCPLDTDPNTGQESPYVAHNAGNYSAVLPLNKALYESSNTYFVGLEDMLFMCNTAPLAQQAINLGMKALTVQGNTVGGQEATFTLGQKSTSPLELANAYATVANDGKYCPATPVISVTDQNGKALPLKQSPCTQQVAPQIAREVVDTLVDDTKLSGGTATSRFGDWYANGGSPVASKTGTNNATTNNVDNNTNSAIWFVGLTPTLVSSAAVFNFQSPTSTISGLPGFDDGYAAGDAFGAAAGVYWLKAYGPTLAANPWSWPSPDDVSGIDVPDVTGQTPGDATAALTAAGFKVSIFDFPCGSSKPSGTLIGYAPHKAVPGSTITACVSNGVAPSGGYSYSYSGNGNNNGNSNGNGNNNNGNGTTNGNGGGTNTNGNGGGGGNGNGGGTITTDGGRPGNGGTPRR